MNKYLTLSLTVASALAQKIPDPLVCEDTPDGLPPFKADSVPCLLREFFFSFFFLLLVRVSWDWGRDWSWSGSICIGIGI
ncbi:hypothetical protein F4813DRAFT_342511, partial [Daldinia decipiens]|uniref:uncharacterized protein n=1 Tax=Daldinia decipiens TaxID=326647 RepID=UPI0020C2D50E